MAQLLIVWHSRTGGARQMADAAAEGARNEVSTLVLRKAAEATADDLQAADGYLFVGPENLAALSGEMKEFFDRCYYPVLGRIEGRPYAQAICAGTDGSGAARQLARIAQGWRLKPVQDATIVCTRADSREKIMADKAIGEDDLARCRDLGQALGAGLEMGAF